MQRESWMSRKSMNKSKDKASKPTFMVNMTESSDNAPGVGTNYAENLSRLSAQKRLSHAAEGGTSYSSVNESFSKQL